jgi:diguanylate cyclase (GGDEF)-like protein
MSGFLVSNECFFQLSRSAFDGIAVWASCPWRIIYANPAFSELTGVANKPAAAGGTLKDSNDPVSSAKLMDLLQRFADAPSTQSILSARVGAGGERRSVDVRLVRLGSEQNAGIGMIIRGSAEPASANADAAMRRDPLTGFPDREFLMRRLADLLRGNRTGDRKFALLFLDLDNFKQVNDEFGHLIGDNVLREAARRIAGCVREGDHVTRFGGDEFVVILEGITEAREVEPVTSRIQAAIAKPIAQPVGEVTLALSAGIVLAADEHRSPEDLLTAADRAMYAAKRNL